MLNDHSKVGIATLVFYIPAVLLSAYLLFHRHRRPRMAWYFLFMFSNVRVATGVVVILYENKPTSVGLLIATIILLGTGVMPLVAVTIGMLRIILAKSFHNDTLLPKIVIVSRAIFLASVVLLVTGGSYAGQYHDPKAVSLGIKLVRAGYIVAVVLLAYLIAIQAFLWTRKRFLDQTSLTVLKGSSAAMLFLVVRLTYSMLTIFEPTSEKWNDLSGSIGVYVGMDLIMEYAAMVAWLSVGMFVPRIEEQARPAEGKASTHREASYTQETLLQKVQRRWRERD